MILYSGSIGIRVGYYQLLFTHWLMRRKDPYQILLIVTLFYLHVKLFSNC